MATVDASRSKKHASPQRPKVEKRKSRVFRFSLLASLVALFAGVGFGPLIVANTPLGPWIVQAALKSDGEVSLGAMSLGWFSSVAVENLEIRDPSGEVLLAVASLRAEKPLVALLLDVSDLGRVQIDHPTLHVVARERDSNFEQTFARLLGGPGGSRISADIEIAEATVLIDDVPAKREFRIDHLALRWAMSDVAETLALTARGAVTDGKRSGDFQIDLQTKGSARNETALASGKLDCQASELPVELVEPLLRRCMERFQLAGRLSARMAGAWGEMAQGGETPALTGQASIADLVIGAGWLGDDRVQLDRVVMPCQIAQQGDRLQIEQLGIQCALGNVMLSGSAKIADLSVADKLSALAHEDFELQGTVDLAQLARMLPQTLRLRERTEITSGQVALVANGKQRADGMTWTGHVNANRLAGLAQGRALAWEQPLAIELAAHETKSGLVFDRARCTSDFLQIDAAGTVDELTASANFDLARLLAVLRQFSDLNHVRLAGQGQAQLAWKRAADDQFTAEATFEARNLQAALGDWHFDEPSLQLAISGRADIGKSLVEIAQGKCAAGNSSVAVTGASARSTSAGWVLDSGQAKVDADLARLYRWRHDPRLPAAWQVAGRLAGDAHFKYDSLSATGSFDGAIDQLHLADLTATRPAAAQAGWNEPRVTLAASGSYQTAGRRLQLDKLLVAANAIQCDAKGAIDASPTGGNVDVKGTLQYDWEQLAPLWRAYLGPGAQITGRQSRAFALHGPLGRDPTSADAWRQVAGEFELGWTLVNFDGLLVGPGNITAQLGDGQLRTQPIDVALGEGRLTAAPVVRLSPGPAEILLGRGPLASNVHLTPELCSQGMRFVTPILARSTVAEGRFSIALDGGRIPLFNPSACDVAGRMAVRAQAKAGPLAQQFLVLLAELKTILGQGAPARITDQSGAVLSIDDANIEFRVVGGRVYHRGLTFTAGGTPVTTHGFVGFDETLAIVAEIPIRAKVLGIDLSLGTLEGTTLEIPIQGTLSSPKLDRRALQDLPGKILKSATRGVLIDEVHRQLDKLLPLQH